MINQVINQGARRLVIIQRLRGVGGWSDNGLVAGHLCLWSFQVVRAVNMSVDNAQRTRIGEFSDTVCALRFTVDCFHVAKENGLIGWHLAKFQNSVVIRINCFKTAD